MFTRNETEQEAGQEVRNVVSPHVEPQTLRIGGASLQGHRPGQEDRWCAIELHDPDTNTVIGGVFDGVGGHAGGALASTAAGRSLCASVGSLGIDEPDLDRAWMYECLVRAGRAAARSGDGATTAVVALVRGPSALVGWAGDSRACIVNPRRGELRWLTQDHHSDSVRGVPALTKWLGRTGDPDTPIFTPGLVETSLDRDDLILLCSDGVHGTLSEHRLIELIRESIWIDDLRESGRWICQSAIDAGSLDNCTCVLIATDPCNAVVDGDSPADQVRSSAAIRTAEQVRTETLDV